jgi:hypothetical protein
VRVRKWRGRSVYWRVDPNTGCWEWQGSRNPQGYGHVNYGGKTWLAHRLMHVGQIGEIPDGWVVMHLCDNPPCVNPNHLRAATYTENVRDMFDKGRANVARGSRNGSSALDEFSVGAIRVLLEHGYQHRHIARWFGVGKSTVARIGRREQWKHVEAGHEL